MNKVKGYINKNRDKTDAFFTINWATRLLMENERFDGKVVEPSCGRGDMSEVIKDFNIVVSSDLKDYGYGEIRDFFSMQSADNIITNPPYSIARKFIEHSLKISKKKVAMLLRLDFLASSGRYEFFREHKPKKILMISKRLPIWNGEQFVGGGQFDHVWIVWDNENPIDKTEFDWVKPE